MALGLGMWGRSVGEPVRTLYLAGEGESGLGLRLQALHDELGDPGDAFAVIAQRMELGPPSADLDAVVRAATQHKAALVVVDTLARTFGPGNEDAAQDMGGFIAAMDRLPACASRWRWRLQRDRGAGGPARRPRRDPGSRAARAAGDDRTQPCRGCGLDRRRRVMVRAATPAPMPAPIAPSTPRDDAARWRKMFEAERGALVANGMTPEFAALGAWWRCVFTLRDDGTAPDAYGADALLMAANITGPDTKLYWSFRWATLRPGDIGSPGSKPPEPALPRPPETFSWAGGQPYVPPPAPERPVTALGFSNAWTARYGAARVAAEDVARDLVDMAAPRRARPEPVTPGEIADCIAALVGGRGIEGGLQFLVHRPAWRATPTAFSIGVPPGMGEVRGSVRPIRATDPELQHVADRVTSLANDDLATGLPAAEGEEADLRMMGATRKAVAAAIEEEHARTGQDRESLRRRLEAAGIA